MGDDAAREAAAVTPLRKRVLIVSFSDVSRDARVARYVDWLAPSWDVTLVSYAPYREADIRSLCVRRRHRGPVRKVTESLLSKTLLRQYEKYYWATYDFSALEPLFQEHFELIIANEYSSLPLVFNRLHADSIVYDAHEYTPEQSSEPMWRLLWKGYTTHLCTAYAKRASVMTTVSRSIAELYARTLHLTPRVLTNAAPFHSLAPSRVKENKIRLVYHGGVSRSRRIDEMIRLMNLTDPRFELHLMLLPSEEAGYLRSLTRQAAKLRNVVLHDPVPQRELIATTNQYDIGLYMMPPSNTNQTLALPNKLFDFIQARLMVAIGPSAEMKRVVDQYGIGIVAEDFRAETMAGLLNRLSATEVAAFKEKTERAARELSAEANRVWYLEMLEGLAAK